MKTVEKVMNQYAYVHACTGLIMVSDQPPTYRGREDVNVTWGRSYFDAGLPGSTDEAIDAGFFRRLTSTRSKYFREQGFFYLYLGRV